MDFGFTEEQEKLKQEVHEFFVNDLPVDYQGEFYAVSKEMKSFHLELQKKVASRGWLAPSWPKEYGGLGLSDVERALVEEEVGCWNIIWPCLYGTTLAGPALMLFGTEEQKRRFIPAIAKGEAIWDEVFTEPDAGSDEANVQLRAVADGDDFILNGQKTFVGEAYKRDYLYTLARTADIVPKHRGLTLFLILANLPGITYRPLPVMTGQIKNEVFFDDVRVPKEYMLGELNRGFYHAMSTLEFERSTTAFPAWLKRNLEEFVQYCKETKRNGKPLIEDPQVRDILAQIAVEVEVFRLTAWVTAWKFSQREKLGPVGYDLTAFYLKIFADRHAKAMVDIMGLYGQLKTGSKWQQLRGVLEHRWQATRSLHAGGTLEIIKVVLAGRGLGLPRQ